MKKSTFLGWPLFGQAGRRPAARRPTRPPAARPGGGQGPRPGQPCRAAGGPAGGRPAGGRPAAGLPEKVATPKRWIFSKMAINRSRQGLRCEPTAPYSEKSTLQGSVYLLIGIQERPEATSAETGGRNFENFAVRLASRPAGRDGRVGKNGNARNGPERLLAKTCQK